MCFLWISRRRNEEGREKEGKEEKVIGRTRGSGNHHQPNNPFSSSFSKMESSKGFLSRWLLFFSVTVAILGFIGSIYGKSFFLRLWETQSEPMIFVTLSSIFPYSSLYSFLNPFILSKDLDWEVEQDRLDWATNCQKDRLFLPSCLQVRFSFPFLFLSFLSPSFLISFPCGV